MQSRLAAKKDEDDQDDQDNGIYCGESIDLEEESYGEDEDEEEDNYEDEEEGDDNIDHAVGYRYRGDQDEIMGKHDYHGGMSGRKWEEVQ